MDLAAIFSSLSKQSKLWAEAFCGRIEATDHPSTECVEKNEKAFREGLEKSAENAIKYIELHKKFEQCMKIISPKEVD